jgi:hypothetical protein
MKNNYCFSIAILIMSFISLAFSQEKEAPKFGINFNGYVKTDYFYDSRQVVNAREGHLLLYPANEQLDAKGEDINAKADFNILSIQSRLTGKITAPDAFGAKTSGVIEAEFFGTSDADVNGVRMRHAYVKLEWEKTSLLLGQYWHPMFNPESFPAVVSINTGAPFQSFIRAPQIRLTHSIGNVNIIAALTAQRDFNSNGPAGYSSNYLKNAVIPNAHIQFQYKENENQFSVGFDYKSLVPRISTTKNYATDEAVSGFSTVGNLKLNLSPVTLKLQGVYGQNLQDMMMLGGYGVKSIDPVTAVEKYIPLNCFAIWGELVAGKDIETALFWGYSKNLGAGENLVGPIYARVSNIDNIYRISPRIQVNSGKTRFSAEIEYTAAAYGTVNLENKGLVEKTKTISDVRVLLAAYYFF